MSAVCPAGHPSTSEDYCDVCGMPIEASAVGSSAAPPPTLPPAPSSGGAQGGQPIGQACPNCDTQNWADALFCENCGYDFTTGTMPRPLDPPDLPPESPVPDAPELPVSAAPLAPPDAVSSPAPSAAPAFAWVAEVWIDPAWYQAQESPDAIPSAGLPEVVALRASSCLIGRVSKSRNIHPEIDCGTDSGVSRRQAQLTTDGNRWWVEDLESANGTFVGSSSGALPEDPIAVGSKTELAGDQRIYVGAWTRIVVRRATEDEQSTLG
ncbi:MAG TPA: FHA domain-containing protein [Propionibacteriaceae bacterium]